jgi:glycosyltransferase involved in cell wall biosynthesis
VIYAYQPPLTVGVAAAIIRLLRRVPVVYDIQDMWPDTLRSTGMIDNKVVLKIVGWVCRLVYWSVDHIVVLSPGFRRLLVQRGVPESKVEVIFNWADETAIARAFDDSLPETLLRPNIFRVLFAGNMGKAQALDAVLAAAGLLQESGRSIQMVFLGGGLDVERLRGLAAAHDIQNVLFLPPVPMSRVGAYLANADALLVHLRRDPLFEITIPSKTQAYLAAGRPVIMAVPGDASDVVLESGGGIVAKPEDAPSIAKAILELEALPQEERIRMGEAARKFYLDRLSIKVGLDQFAVTLRRFAEPNDDSR